MDDAVLNVLRHIRDVLTAQPQFRAEHFRSDRLAEIAAGRTPVPLPEHPKTVLHMIPYGSLSGTPKFFNVLGSRDLLPYPGVKPALPNIEGVITHNEVSYAQLYRTGIIEAVDASSIEDDAILSTEAFERELHERLGRYVMVLSRIGVEPPVAVMLSLLGVANVWLPNWRGERRQRLGVPNIICPPHVFERWEDFDPVMALKPGLNVIANAAGLLRWESE